MIWDGQLWASFFYIKVVPLLFGCQSALGSFPEISSKEISPQKQERKYLCGNMFFLYFVRNFVPQIKLIVLFLNSLVCSSSCLLVRGEPHKNISSFCFSVIQCSQFLQYNYILKYSEMFAKLIVNCVEELISQTHSFKRSIPPITSDYVRIPAMILLQFWFMLQYIAMIHLSFSFVFTHLLVFLKMFFKQKLSYSFECSFIGVRRYTVVVVLLFCVTNNILQGATNLTIK